MLSQRSEEEASGVVVDGGTSRRERDGNHAEVVVVEVEETSSNDRSSPPSVGTQPRMTFTAPRQADSIPQRYVRAVVAAVLVILFCCNLPCGAIGLVYAGIISQCFMHRPNRHDKFFSCLFNQQARTSEFGCQLPLIVDVIDRACEMSWSGQSDAPPLHNCV